MTILNSIPLVVEIIIGVILALVGCYLLSFAITLGITGAKEMRQSIQKGKQDETPFKRR